MTTVRLHELDVNAAELITNALRNLLSLASTQQTIAQIIDDMPIQGHYYGLNSSARYPDPDIERRPAPSDNATQVAQRLCSEFDLSTVAIKAKVSLAELRLASVHY